MNQQELLIRINALLGRFTYEVRVSNATGLFDINILAEDFLVPILSVIFDCPELKNQNRVQMNFPAVDLGCDKSRISIQVTSDPSATKICKTIKKFREHGLHSLFDTLYIYVISERQKTYRSSTLDTEIKNFPIKFNTQDNILDYKSLAERLRVISNEKLGIILTHLESEFDKVNSNLKFKKNLNEFISVSQKKIEDEKKTKKYIPSVFVETSEIKDSVRFFSNPKFFYRKIDYDLQRINFKNCNHFFELAKVEPLNIEVNDLISLPVPNSLKDLNVRLLKQKEIISQFKKTIAPLSWQSEKNEKFSPQPDLINYWRVFQYNIESIATGIYNQLNDVLDKIKISTSKIFLVTGMAGQGKTNFVCDLVENQLQQFEVPTIFIPGRLLNHYSSPNRILSYITNNRFCPSLSNLHELFELLDNVASESGKPFIIALDGINEVSDLQGFIDEFKVFLEALCQYDYIKIIVTCRNEFFDHKFSKVFEPQFSDYLYWVQDLRNEMSDNNKSKLLTEYFEYFNINLRLSEVSKNFLMNDLILLRLFCEIYEGQDIGYVPDIYKGELFERYLMMKIEQFLPEQKSIAISSLKKICHQMLKNENFSLVSNAGFNAIEKQVIDKLVGEDIILRREVPPSGLMSLGIENISFTYDEMRDFLLAYFMVVDVEPDKQDTSIFKKMSDWPIYEGLFRYTYILARKYNNQDIISLCEDFDDFNTHYLNNLPLLSSNLQSDEDVKRIRSILRESTISSEILSVAWFLFRKRDTSEQLNLGVLNSHLGTLNNDESEQFFSFMYGANLEYRRNDWRENLNRQIGSLKDYSDENKMLLDPLVLAFILYTLPYAYWRQREHVLNFFNKYKDHHNVAAAIASCRNSCSEYIQSYLDELDQGVKKL
ncbi:TPA: SMEK domain-containing protein [Proteus mirabilis]|uniref:SMEK domain-containing protein n=1 Tax=Proteus mirabilis TaxID=584 RepID=UPI001A2E72E9|nr:SMEK domain-containing protein [Proteus mirabilis]MBI6438668.1 SMEK domain-containing protein [Proteus mirabilis]MCZ4601831.1 SMEK domain-containing protein [Proteus mirabilis]HEJ9754733.1 SMEK domain-containing protein [Proteus mirabilis]HEK3215029.1 SMEK domain-containing protein [Proteus mirabilis]